MKFYRGLVNVGKEPVVTQIHRGFKPMTYNADRRPVQIANAAPVNPLSAAEVVLLRHIHGDDSVTELYEVGEKKQLSFAAERDRLEHEYGKKVVETVFGARGIRAALPREVENIGPEPEDAPVELALTANPDEDALDDPAEESVTA